MTMALGPTPLPVPSPIAARELRRGLTALLRRRLPAQDVEDVAQTVLCDALAASHIPSDPEELRRWLTGIARHKIVDFHRRSARERARGGGGESSEVAARVDAPEERELLERLLNQPRTRRDAETFEWLVREHDGERLADIAAETQLPPPVVRQRVSRLRRALRERWAVGLLILLAATAGTLKLIGDDVPSRMAITSDPSARKESPPTPAERLARELAGDWVLEKVTPNRALSPGELRWLETASRSARVHVQGSEITLDARILHVAGHVTRAEEAPDGTWRLGLVATDGKEARVTLRRLSGGRVEVVAGGARFGGAAIFKRPAP